MTPAGSEKRCLNEGGVLKGRLFSGRHGKDGAAITVDRIWDVAMGADGWWRTIYTRTEQGLCTLVAKSICAERSRGRRSSRRRGTSKLSRHAHTLLRHALRWKDRGQMQVQKQAQPRASSRYRESKLDFLSTASKTPQTTFRRKGCRLPSHQNHVRPSREQHIRIFRGAARRAPSCAAHLPRDSWTGRIQNRKAPQPREDSASLSSRAEEAAFQWPQPSRPTRAVHHLSQS